MSIPTRLYISPAEVSDLIRCDFENGKLYWNIRDISSFRGDRRAAASWNARFSGKEAFTCADNRGYLVGAIFGKKYLAHRLVYCLAYGAWADQQIDHINGVRTDNRLNNLRLASNAENHRNQKMPSTNTSGAVGVYLERRTGSWIAQIYADRKKVHLGTFANKEAAISARGQAEIQYGYHRNHGR